MVQHEPHSALIFRFGVFEVDLAAGELRKHGEKIRLQEQPFQVLVMLLERAGDVVTRDEICRRLWPPGTFVDFEQGLGTAMKKLRQALSDDAETPHYIETLPKRGFRFIAAVEKIPAFVPPAPARRLEWSWKWSAVTVTCLFAAAVVLWWIRSPSSRREASDNVLPLTSFPGIESSPTFSPDGDHIAFSWNGEQRDNFDIYVKPVGSGPALRLTSNPASDINPSWSPDGHSIAFHRLLPNNRAAVIEIPSLGGPERLLTEISIPPSSPFGPFSSWYLDNTSLAIADRANASGDASSGYSIFLISRDTGERRLLTRPPPGIIGDSSPAFSPDGKSLVFIRSVGHAIGDLYVVPVSSRIGPGREPKRLTREKKSIVRPAWTPDGSHIIFGVEENVGSLWKVSSLGGKAERLSVGGDMGQTPAVSARGNRLAYSRRIFDTNIWRMPIPGKRNNPSGPVALTPSTRMEWDPRISPDGKRIAFASDRSGYPEIWLCDASGDNPAPLTSFRAAGLGSPRWSRDGNTLAFDSALAGQWDIYTIAVNGGNLKQITNDAANDHVPAWSSDSSYLYFGSDRTGGFQVWKVPVAGGQPRQVTRNGGFSAFESVDGQTIYYSRQNADDQIGIWSVPVGGGPERSVIDSIHVRNFDLTRHGIYFVPRKAESPFELRFLDFATRSTREILKLHQQLYSTLSVSADEKWLLYSTIDQEGSNLMLVENFH